MDFIESVMGHRAQLNLLKNETLTIPGIEIRLSSLPLYLLAYASKSLRASIWHLEKNGDEASCILKSEEDRGDYQLHTRSWDMAPVPIR
jgi:hypothetical protein